ncbi:hypothetical protein [Roseateles asaccharophilus]|uniref:DUF3299 domain-containing protein n=1 Tax=Roseateles asaccharophilus TaxID=582607 RepID=A0ABU2A8X3_9BURK|nr:hypothetical protein [Roseateles asaccharophilus]MDR7333644.1 hypothetical protein [Roseateles asaccharophilus]
MRLRSLLPAWAVLCGLAMPASAQPLALAFSDFFAQPIGPRGLQPSAALKAAAGREVRITGFMVRRERPQAGQFLLTPRPVTMAEHADGEADDLPPSTVTVQLDAAHGDRLVAYQPGPLTLTGRLEFGPAEDATGRISWLRLQLAPAALAELPSAAQPAHSH